MKRIISVNGINGLTHIRYANCFGSQNPRNRAAYVIIGRKVIFTETNNGTPGPRQSVRDRPEEVIRAIMANEEGMDGRDYRFYDLRIDANCMLEEVVPTWVSNCIRPIKVERRPAKYDPEKIGIYFSELINRTEETQVPIIISGSRATKIYRPIPQLRPGLLLQMAA